ncbi:MAG: hypothetical protein ABSH20_32150, partial [Tepidisphaeraceae bacterium]
VLINRILFPGQFLLPGLELPWTPPASLRQRRHHRLQEGSVTHPFTGLPSRWAQSRASSNSRRTSAAELEISLSANHTRRHDNSRTTYNVSCPFSGCKPSIESTTSLTSRYSSANGRADTNSAMLLVVTGTNFKRYDDISGDPGKLAREYMERVEN